MAQKPLLASGKIVSDPVSSLLSVRFFSGIGGLNIQGLWRSMRKTLLILVVVMLPTILAGCATTPSYHASIADRSQGAIIRAWSSGTFAFFTFTALEKVDGQRVSIWSPERLLVDPGLRVMSVAGTYVGAFGVRDTARVELTATLEAGHAYVLKAELSEKLMTLWIEDQDTRELVSEKKTSGTTRWIQWL